VERSVRDLQFLKTALTVREASVVAKLIITLQRGKGRPSKARTSRLVPNGDVERVSWDLRRSLLVKDLLGVMECPVDKIWDEENTIGFSLPR
jgi:hypothetical protein